MHAFAASASSPDQRVMTMSRFVTADKSGLLLGTLFSSILLEAGGYASNYSIKAAFTTIGIIWTLFFCKEPMKEEDKVQVKSRKEHNGCMSTLVHSLDNYVWQPLKEMVKTFVRKRPGNLRTLLYLQVLSWAIHYAVTHLF